MCPAFEPANQDEIERGRRTAEEIERAIADLQGRWPVHSVPPTMVELMEALEDELATARGR